MQATFIALHGELIGFAGFVNNNQDVIRRWQRRSNICITERRFPVRGYFFVDIRYLFSYSLFTRSSGLSGCIQKKLLKSAGVPGGPNCTRPD